MRFYYTWICFFSIIIAVHVRSYSCMPDTTNLAHTIENTWILKSRSGGFTGGTYPLAYEYMLKIENKSGLIECALKFALDDLDKGENSAMLARIKR